MALTGVKLLDWCFTIGGVYATEKCIAIRRQRGTVCQLEAAGNNDKCAPAFIKPLLFSGPCFFRSARRTFCTTFDSRPSVPNITYL